MAFYFSIVFFYLVRSFKICIVFVSIKALDLFSITQFAVLFLLRVAFLRHFRSINTI